MDYHEEVIVAATDKIPFKYVVRVMDLCRIAGFEKSDCPVLPRIRELRYELFKKTV